jgi:cell division protein YceG involved in septum cleavage
LSRGDRSRPGRGRTAEERERDRQERARRRGLREHDDGAAGSDLAGAPQPGAPAESPSATHGAPADALAPEASTVDAGSSPPAAPIAQTGLAPHDPAPAQSPSEAPMLHPPAYPSLAAQPGSESVAAGEPDLEQTLEQPVVEQPVVEQPAPAPTAAPPVQASAPAPPPDALGEPRRLESTPQSPLPPTRVPPPPVPAPAATADTLRTRKRTLLARLTALAALAAVVVAVLLLAHSLRSKQAATIAAPTVVRVLIPEGKTRAQIAQIAKDNGLTGSYRAASRRSPLLNPTSYGAPRATRDLEGFLFPATYDMDKGAPAQRLVDEQLVAFREHFSERYVARAHALHLTAYELLIVASMIEREAQLSSDRAKVAAVIYNRLRQGMALGVDATIYYAVEQATGIPTYTRELTYAQLHMDSPYNTRTHTGLPPTPIANPGLASIRAAAYPAQVSYLYYVSGADGCGEQVFSDTQAAFEADEAAYRAALAKHGGHLPTCNKHG